MLTIRSCGKWLIMMFDRMIGIRYNNQQYSIKNVSKAVDQVQDISWLIYIAGQILQRCYRNSSPTCLRHHTAADTM